MRKLALISMLVTTACTAIPTESEPAQAGASVHRCSAEELSDLVGRPATAELGGEALRRSGSRTLRWIRPGDAVTMDFREDRLNIHLDARNRVERFDCG